MSDQDKQANMTKQVAQSKPYGHMTKTDSPSPVYAEENILNNNVDFYCNIFTYTFLTKIKVFSHWFTSMQNFYQLFLTILLRNVESFNHITIVQVTASSFPSSPPPLTKTPHQSKNYKVPVKCV